MCRRVINFTDSFQLYIYIMRRVLITIVLFILPWSSDLSAQQRKDHPYLSSLLEGKDNSSLFYFQFGFCPISRGNLSNSGHGFQTFAGINLLRFAVKKGTIGVFVGYKFREYLWPCKYKSEFADDLRSSLVYDNGTVEDSVLWNYFGTQSGKGQQALGGMGFYQWGLMLNYPKLFCPFIKIYRSHNVELVEAYRYNGVYEDDWIYFSSHRYSGISCGWDVGSIFAGEKTGFLLSVYYERSEMKNFRLNDRLLRDYVTPDFLERNPYAWRAGIVISAGFY